MYKELSSTFIEPLHLDKSGQTVLSVNNWRVDGLFIRNGSDLHRYDCKSQGQGPHDQGQGLTLKAKAKAKDWEFVLEDPSSPRTKAKDNNTASFVRQTSSVIRHV